MALITARGGSRGMPRKNVLSLAGKPLIAWSVEAALKSRRIERTIISTDDPEIADIAKKCGAEVPFMRPPELAGDNVRHMPVVRHAVKWMEQNGNYIPDYVMLLQPTSPLRNVEDIENTIRLAEEKKPDAVISVKEIETHPFYSREITGDGFIRDFPGITQGELIRQEIPDAYTENGSIYLVKRNVILEQESLIPRNSLAYIMPKCRNIDIDTEWEFRLAELIILNKLS